MDLYTTLEHLKRSMNGGALPPMTPLSEKAKQIIDPSLTIDGDGAGGLVEDAERGLLCPIRGCGEYHHKLGLHIAFRHRSISSSAFREAMGIPETIGLISKRERELHRTTSMAGVVQGKGSHLETAGNNPAAQTPRARELNLASRKRSVNSTMARNLRGHCIAQLKHLMIDLANSVGRSPSVKDARAVWGGKHYDAILKTFGSWNNAKAQCGLDVLVGNKKPGPRTTKEEVIDALEAWFLVHGDLPSAVDAKSADRAPAIHAYETILNVMEAAVWRDAMAKAALVLGVHSPRFSRDQEIRASA